MSGTICGFCGKKMHVRAGVYTCLNLACSSNRTVGQCDARRMGYDWQPATDKQLALISKLAREVEQLSGQTQETGAHCKHCASVQIENLLAGKRYYQRKR